MIRVTVTKDGQLIQRKDLGGAEVIFGREREADIQLFGPAVSRRHARLQHGANGWQIADLGAANGVYVVRGAQEPKRVVIEDVAAGDRILIEAFTVSFEEMSAEDEAALEGLDDLGFDEDSLETKRTQFISMQDVLAGTDIEKLRAAGADIPEFSVSRPRHVAADASPDALTSAAQGESSAPISVVPSSAPPSTWWAKLESSEGHRRVFELTRPHATVGTASRCDVELPSGPPLLLEIDRAGGTINLARTARWPFPRIKVDGNVVKNAILGDTDGFSVGKLDVTFFLNEPPAT